MTINIAFVLLFILIIFTFAILLIVSSKEYRRIFISKQKVEKIKSNSQPINVELIDAFLIDKYNSDQPKVDIHYVLKDISSNKMYCIIIDRNPALNALEIERHNTNTLFSHNWETIREKGKVIGYKYTTTIKNLDKDKDVKLNDVGQLWIMENGITNSLSEIINNEKELEKTYINNLNHERYIDKKDNRIDRLLNLNPENDYKILKECEFISGVIEFK